MHALLINVNAYANPTVIKAHIHVQVCVYKSGYIDSQWQLLSITFSTGALHHGQHC